MNQMTNRPTQAEIDQAQVYANLAAVSRYLEIPTKDIFEITILRGDMILVTLSSFKTKRVFKTALLDFHQEVRKKDSLSYKVEKSNNEYIAQRAIWDLDRNFGPKYKLSINGACSCEDAQQARKAGLLCKHGMAILSHSTDELEALADGQCLYATGRNYSRGV